METAHYTVKNLSDLFLAELSGLYAPEEIRSILYVLFDEYAGLARTAVHLSYNAEIPDRAAISFREALKRLSSGEPVQYVIGKAWFNGMILKVGPGVLVPRPETEELCELVGRRLAERALPAPSILDIGTGSGCIAIDLKQRFPGAVVTAIDVSATALAVAAGNALANRCNIAFLRADILSESGRNCLGNFNLVVSNPPYVTESEENLMHRNVAGFEPHLALFVPDNDPLVFYRAIAGFACSHLVRPGMLFFEINERFGKEVAKLLTDCGYSDIAILKDLSGKDRFAEATLK